MPGSRSAPGDAGAGSSPGTVTRSPADLVGRSPPLTVSTPPHWPPGRAYRNRCQIVVSVTPALSPGDILTVPVGNYVSAASRNYVSDNTQIENFISADILATADSLMPVSSSSFSGHRVSQVRSAVTAAR